MRPTPAAGHVASMPRSRSELRNRHACASSNRPGRGGWHHPRGDADVMVAGGSERPSASLWFVRSVPARPVHQAQRRPAPRVTAIDVDRDGFVIADGRDARLEDLEKRGRAERDPAGSSATGVGRCLHGPSPPWRTRCRDQHADRARRRRTGPEGWGHQRPRHVDPPMTRPDVGHQDRLRRRRISSPISSTKSMTGHCGRSVASRPCLRPRPGDGTLPPPSTSDSRPDCDLDYVPNVARQVPIATAMSNAFGFRRTQRHPRLPALGWGLTNGKIRFWTRSTA